jgi:hypothetical protein
MSKFLFEPKELGKGKITSIRKAPVNTMDNLFNASKIHRVLTKSIPWSNGEWASIEWICVGIKANISDSYSLLGPEIA